MTRALGTLPLMCRPVIWMEFASQSTSEQTLQWITPDSIEPELTRNVVIGDVARVTALVRPEVETCWRANAKAASERWAYPSQRPATPGYFIGWHEAN